MKKYKFIDIINFICVFLEIYEILIFICAVLRGFFETEIFTKNILIVQDFCIDVFSSKLMFPLFIMFGFFGIVELFIIIENYKFNDYFFPSISQKTRNFIARFSVIAFIINILYSYMYYLIMIF